MRVLGKLWLGRGDLALLLAHRGRCWGRSRSRHSGYGRGRRLGSRHHRRRSVALDLESKAGSLDLQPTELPLLDQLDQLLDLFERQHLRIPSRVTLASSGARARRPEPMHGTMRQSLPEAAAGGSRTSGTRRTRPASLALAGGSSDQLQVEPQTSDPRFHVQTASRACSLRLLATSPQRRLEPAPRLAVIRFPGQHGAKDLLRLVAVVLLQVEPAEPGADQEILPVRT